jgi:transposase
MLAQIDSLDGTIAPLSGRIEELTRPFSREIELLDTSPGIDRRAAEMLLAEIGPDMSRFPTEAYLASWGGMCPSQRESAGKKHSAATRKGSKWLRGTLTESANAVVRTKGTYLSARYQRIKSRRGHAKATIATAHKILPAACHVLQRGVPYDELGEAFFHRPRHRAPARYRRRLIHQLERLGHEVTLEPLPEAACAPASFSIQPASCWCSSVGTATISESGRRVRRSSEALLGSLGSAPCRGHCRPARSA